MGTFVNVSVITSRGYRNNPVSPVFPEIFIRSWIERMSKKSLEMPETTSVSRAWTRQIGEQKLPQKAPSRFSASTKKNWAARRRRVSLEFSRRSMPRNFPRRLRATRKIIVAGRGGKEKDVSVHAHIPGNTTEWISFLLSARSDRKWLTPALPAWL